ncbi:dihydrodipicolinate synthase family protein, partial [Alistipes communis]|uniref:dihydrodipicolinate synthase family protein n=1 Tax=Alistipes communis TaxID=2585118 RepID=UPI00266F0224
IAVDVMRRGGDGVISVAVHAFPRRFMACIDLAKRGDFDAAETAFAPMHEVVEALFAEGNPTGVKCALSILGLIGNRLRLPLVAGTPALEARLRELIRTYDLR